MQRHSVTSTSITSVGYDPATQVLEVEFHTGRRYWYRGVTPDEHARLMAAPSIGAYVAHHIKPRYPATEVPE